MEQPGAQRLSHALLPQQDRNRQETPAKHQQKQQQQQQQLETVAGNDASTRDASITEVREHRLEAAAAAPAKAAALPAAAPAAVAALAAAAPVCPPRGTAHTPVTTSTIATACNAGATSHHAAAVADTYASKGTPILKSLISRTQRRKLLAVGAMAQRHPQQQAAAGHSASRQPGKSRSQPSTLSGDTAAAAAAAAAAVVCKSASKAPLEPSIQQNLQKQQQQADSTNKQKATAAAPAERKRVVSKRSAADAAADGGDRPDGSPNQKAQEALKRKSSARRHRCWQQ